MKIHYLSKDETNHLEQNTTPIENILQYESDSMEPLFQLQMWYSHHGYTMNMAVKQRVEALAGFIGNKPVYHKQYEYRTAVWGLSITDTPFVFYYSKRGLSIQVPYQTTKATCMQLLHQLVELLDVGDVSTPYGNKRRSQKS